MKSVAIFGTGIAGLSAAHELAEKGYKIDVYEKLSEPGGVARSYREDDSSAPSEYSWRGYGPWYHNAFSLMKRIPIGNGKTVYDNLTRPVKFVFTQNVGKFIDELSIRDRVVFSIEIARSASGGIERTKYYATINAADYMRDKMTTNGWKQFTSMFGPWVGIDSQRASLHHVMSFMVKNIIPGSSASYYFQDDKGTWKVGGRSKWLVFNKPTNEAWFNPWVKHLESMNVRFRFNYELYSISLDTNNRIDRVLVNSENNRYNVKADYYIIAISPFGMLDVLKRSLSDSKSDILQKEYIRYQKLTQDGPHVQVSFRIGFDTEFKWECCRTAVIVSSSEFNITMYRQEELWSKDVILGPDIKSLWSGTACVSYIPGSLFGKPLTALTKDEFKQEIYYQLSKDKGFNQMLREDNGISFEQMKDRIIHFEVWKNWKFAESDNV